VITIFMFSRLYGSSAGKRKYIYERTNRIPYQRRPC